MFARNKSSEEDVQIFTIFDSKSKSYELPTFSMNKESLLREVLNMFRDPSQSRNKFLTNAEDFSVFKIGSYDRKTGILTPINLEHVANMHDLRALAEPMEASRALSAT